MARYAMLVAADEYANFSPTPFCHADAELLKETLVGHCDYAPQHVKTLLLSPQDSKTPEELLAEMGELVAGSTAGDTILFFFAGHGAVEGTEPFLILPGTEAHRKEATALMLRDVTQRLRLDGRVCVRILDACHSGYDVRAPDEPNSQEFARAIAQPAFSEGWMTLAACGPKEYSYSDSGNGVFTRAFSDAIRAVPENANVLLEDLKVKVCDAVENWSNASRRRQTPTFNSAISGNHPIAQRRAPEARIGMTAPEGTTPSVPLTERLAKIRQFPPPGSEQHRNALSTAFGPIEARLSEHTARFPKEWGVNCVPRQSSYQRALPEPSCRDIVQWLRDKKLWSLHSVESKTEEARSRPRFPGLASISSILEPFYEPSKTEYLVELNDWPETRAGADVQSDGVCPSAIFWVYLCPLKLRSVLFVGYIVGHKRWFDATLLSEVIVDADVEKQLDQNWAHFIRVYSEGLVASLDALEAEQKA